MAGRRAARRTALILLYQWDVTGQELASLYEGEVDDYARSLAERVVERHEELDRRITDAADEWTADRLGALERNILRLAIVELDEDAVPVEVAIDEAVTLAKRYASEDAGRLVNGILGKIVQETRAWRRLDGAHQRAEVPALPAPGAGVNRYPALVVVFGVLVAGIGVALIVDTAVHGGGVGYLLGLLFVAAGAGRIYLLRRRR
jgi:N utilization substance protein B